LLDRPKTGFSVPLGPWIRGPLRDWAADLLTTPSLRQGPLDPARVDRAFRHLLAGRDDIALECWAYLQFESWRRTWCP
jgi:asparagine synthase (glutamine-hydrolysing)